ncbi:hypothetical protein PF008_g24220 [Phytophthora fragariae]|uniref:Uncharacterized protein n=1 Tax=Phytophthora fragariae TaxID=53985 RepID=A0A6G0QNJ1_9STRA|nr:hypothetical protein PF008_g24220 [Phytophthora fragariae]
MTARESVIRQHGRAGRAAENPLQDAQRGCPLRPARAGAPTSTDMLSMRAGIELEKCEEIECTILGLHLLLTTGSTTCTAASKKNSGFVLFAAVQVVDVNSPAASRVKIIQTDVNEDVYPYLVRLVYHRFAEVDLARSSSLQAGTDETRYVDASIPHQ